MAKVVAMKFRETKFRAFYRIFILPRHIAKRDGEVKKAMQAELAEWQEMVEANGLQEELAAYIAAQEDRQAKYDAMIAAETELGQNPSAEAGQKPTEAKLAFAESKAAFVAAYH